MNLLSYLVLFLAASSLLFANGLPLAADDDDDDDGGGGFLLFVDEEGEDEDEAKGKKESESEEEEETFFFFGGTGGEKQDEEITRNIGPDSAIDNNTKVPPIPADLKCDPSTELPGWNSSESRWSCHGLATRGPCSEENEWFVLDEGSDPEDPRGVCKARDCEGENEVLYLRVCQETGVSAYCPKGMELLVNPFGQGECDCLEGFLPFDNSRGHPECAQEFLRGPCHEDEHYVTDDTADLGASCRHHNCTSGQVLWSNGDCITPVTCDDPEEAMFFEEETKMADCIAVRQLIVIPVRCPEGQSLNHAGECKRIVRFNSRPKRRLATRNLSLRNFLQKRFDKKGKGEERSSSTMTTTTSPDEALVFFEK